LLAGLAGHVFARFEVFARQSAKVGNQIRGISRQSRQAACPAKCAAAGDRSDFEETLSHIAPRVRSSESSRLMGCPLASIASQQRSMVVEMASSLAAAHSART
jgi:hypothetical protein